MTVAIGPVEIRAFEACIMDGNHNNAPLIDRCLLSVDEKLMNVAQDVFDVICKVAFLTGTEDSFQRRRREAQELAIIQEAKL